MQTFTCPECGHESAYDPWIESAHCARCGYSPTKIGRLRSRYPRKKTGTHQPFLDELLAHWNNTHKPDPTFTLPTRDLALAFFHDYQRAMGEDPHIGMGDHMRYIRNYHPQESEILTLVGAYMLLKQGDRATAARHLGTLTMTSPDFADPWIWLTATTDDPGKRIEYLKEAVVNEPAHPLARDAMAIASGRVSPAERPKQGEEQAAIVKCPRCAGSLHYEPGAQTVACPYCGHQFDLPRVNLLERKATPIGDLQLRRRYQGYTWSEAQRVLSCQACGAELIMTHHLTKQCTFCGSTTVLVEDTRRSFEQPDGFLPFRITEQQAIDAIEKARRFSVQGLKSWLIGKEQDLGELTGVYLPFWIFDGFVEIRVWDSKSPEQITPEGGKTPAADMMMFDNLVYAGVQVPPPALIKRIFPFETADLVPYDPRLLADWSAALYSRDVEVAVEEAYDAMIAMARQRALPLATQAEGRRGPGPGPVLLRRSFQVSSTTYQLVLLPVWVARLKHKEPHSLALVNGQTGQAVVHSRLLSLLNEH